MTSYQGEERSKLKKHWVDRAISLAMQNRWEEAVAANRAILDFSPRDVDSYNRLGRALTELGNYREAREAYQRALELDPSNAIAQKNLARLANLTLERAPEAVRGEIDPRLFIADTGKAGVTSLLRISDKATLAQMTIGDQVSLDIQGRMLVVRNARGEYLGQVEPRLSQRLIELMRGGNRYAAALMSIDDNDVRVIIRETYQHPSQAGKLSFPAKVAETRAFRAYIKDTLLRRDIDETEEGTDVVDYETEPDTEDEEAIVESGLEGEEIGGGNE